MHISEYDYVNNNDDFIKVKYRFLYSVNTIRTLPTICPELTSQIRSM